MNANLVRPEDTKIFLLCGGLGTRFREQTVLRPKPMVEIAGEPILLHIMKTYAKFGFRKFVLMMGYKSEIVRDYFLNFYQRNVDATVSLTGNSVTFNVDHDTKIPDWEITLAFTGELTLTGGRLQRALSRYLGQDEHFGVSYGDGLTDANLDHEFAYHCSHGKIGTVLGVNPPSRFGEFQLNGDVIEAFEEKPHQLQAWINGGFFFFRRAFQNYLPAGDDNLTLEQAPLAQLARDGELRVFRHSGYWACMDTQRDCDELNRLCDEGIAPWRKTVAAD